MQYGFVSYGMLKGTGKLNDELPVSNAELSMQSYLNVNLEEK